jgi:hypothetical protein
MRTMQILRDILDKMFLVSEEEGLIKGREKELSKR